MNQLVSILLFTIRDSVPFLWMSDRLAEGHRKGYWQFPGGKIEGDETIMVAGPRELREETGLDLPTGRFIRLTSTNAIHPSRGEYTVHWLALELTNEEVPKRTEPLENGEWVALTVPEVALRTCLPGTKRATAALLDLFQRGPFG